MTSDELLAAVLALYADSVKLERFNGVRLDELPLEQDDDELRETIVTLIRSRKLDCLAPPALNPHIKRFPAPPPESQIGYLDVKEKYHTVLYPTPELISEALDLSFLNAKPFSRGIAAGAAQLEPVFFEIAALDRYRQDPRYSFHFDGYAGTMSLSVPEEQYKEIPDRDQVHVQTFGLGLDGHRHPVVAVFLRYLAQLTAEHQQMWNSYRLFRSAKIHENYYRASLLGEFYVDSSAIAALRLSVDGINRVCEAVWGKRLFRIEIPDAPHYNLTPFMKPTTADLLSFAHELDKLISENLEKASLSAMIKEKAPIDSELRKLGTIGLLEKWLFSGVVKWKDEDNARREIIGPLRKLRHLRQQPAHAIVTNQYDPAVYKQRRDILGDVAFSLGSLFQMLKRHPRAPEIRVPEWFENSQIEIL
jgi:hypothetical protein